MDAQQDHKRMCAAFDEWVKDDDTHWLSDHDAAYQGFMAAWEMHSPGPGPVLRTPLHITLLIRICVGDMPLQDPQRSAPATVEYLAELEAWGAIVPDGAGWYEGTALGQHWLNRLHQVPRPGDGGVPDEGRVYPSACRCTFEQSVVGDGCPVCRPDDG